MPLGWLIKAGSSLHNVPHSHKITLLSHLCYWNLLWILTTL